jgi:hypothetical protein
MSTLQIDDKFQDLYKNSETDCKDGLIEGNLFSSLFQQHSNHGRIQGKGIRKDKMANQSTTITQFHKIGMHCTYRPTYCDS